jgi:hypothetical protein
VIRVLAVLLAFLAGPAHGAGFDEFQVIMWQDRTPAQRAGLARLGFTANRLHGTGGQIDAAMLTELQESGLRWYLENIATDFYAPYHRYTPGKPVTWLFDAAKARLRADPTDTSVFLRQPGLSDSTWLAAIQARLEQVVRRQSPYRPLFYNLADEAGIGDLAANWDADIAPASMTAMRQWLRAQYPDLDTLNRQWATGFADWGSVVPELTDAALRRTDDNFSAWADFKAWMDVAFAAAVAKGTEAVHRADPAALAALEGGQLPGWGGYDYSRLASTVDVMEIYDVGDAPELARAFNPALIALRTSFGTGPRETHAAWRSLLRGGRGMIVWDEKDDVVLPDGEPAPRGLHIRGMLASLRAAAPTLMTAEPSPDPVAVLYSQASFRTRWLLDQRARGLSWTDRDAGREYEDNAWRASRRQILRRLAAIAVQPRLLSSAMVEAGALNRDGLRVLILPHAIALSDNEIAAIKAFAAQGGTVVADAEPGVFDQHSRRRAVSPLKGVAQLPEVVMLDGGGDSPEGLSALSALLRDAGVTPRVVLLGPDGMEATGVDAHWFRRGDTAILALHAARPWEAPGQISVRLSTPATVSDVMAPGLVKRQQEFTVTLDPVTPAILSLER